MTEGLLAYDLDLRPIPQLATAWSIGEDGLRYTLAPRRSGVHRLEFNLDNPNIGDRKVRPEIAYFTDREMPHQTFYHRRMFDRTTLATGISSNQADVCLG